MAMANVPPTRTSTLASASANGDIQRASKAGSVHAAKTGSGDAVRRRRSSSRSAIAQDALQRVQPRLPERAVVIDPARGIAQVGWHEGDEVVAADDAAAHQPGSFEHLDVFRDRVQRDGKGASQLGDAPLAAAEVVQDGAARGVGKRAKGGVQDTLNHSVEYSASGRQCQSSPTAKSTLKGCVSS